MEKMIQVTQSSMPDIHEYYEEIKDIWNTHVLTNMGPKHKQLEKSLSDYLGVPNVVMYTNGHLALECCLSAYQLTGEVITTPFTFASTTHAIIRAGLTPVFCDIKRSDFTIDTTIIESLITDKTTAILPVHVYGNICDVEEIDRIAKKHGLKVIYDAAHAFGVKVNGIGIGTFGDASMFSFHATKVFHTIEGGAITIKDNHRIPILNGYKNFGITGPESVEYIGGNAKMNEFQAAMGICNLRHVDREIEKRRVVSLRYLERLKGIPGIILSMPQKDILSNYAYFPVLFDGFPISRDVVFEKLKSHGIIARKYFYPLTNSFKCYEGRFNPNDTPVAQYVANRVLTLPLYAELSLDDVDRVCNLILEMSKL